MASICNDEWASLGVMSGHERKTRRLSAQRMELKRSDLRGAPGLEVIVALAEYKAGEAIELHLHHDIEAA